MSPPRVHRVETYNGQGNLVDVQETPYTPEEELVADQAQEFNDLHLVAIQSLQNWASLTPAQKDAVLRTLLRWALWKDGRLPGGL